MTSPVELSIAVFLTHDSIECWNFRERHLTQMLAALPACRVVPCATEAEFRSELKNAQVAIVWSFDEAWLSEAPQLEWLVTPAAGRDYFHVRPTEKLSIDYGSFHGELMGETVLAFLLADARGVFASMRLHDESWPRSEVGETMRPLRGAKITILGFGSIGRWIGKLAKSFGVCVTGVARTDLKPAEWFDADDRVVGAERLDEVLADTDYLVLALPSGSNTDHVVDAARLRHLPSTAAIVNVGRGNSIDEKALVDALDQDRLRAAYLDVFEEEPLPMDSRLRGHAKVIRMPHASAIAPNYLDLFVDEFIDKFDARYGKR